MCNADNPCAPRTEKSLGGTSSQYAPGAFREEAQAFLRERLGNQLYEQVMESEESRTHPYVPAKVFLGAADWKKYVWIEQHGSLRGFPQQEDGAIRSGL